MTNSRPAAWRCDCAGSGLVVQGQAVPIRRTLVCFGEAPLPARPFLLDSGSETEPDRHFRSDGGPA